jgi:hypothetical protein
MLELGGQNLEIGGKTFKKIIGQGLEIILLIREDSG